MINVFQCSNTHAHANDSGIKKITQNRTNTKYSSQTPES